MTQKVKENSKRPQPKHAGMYIINNLLKHASQSHHSHTCECMSHMNPRTHNLPRKLTQSFHTQFGRYEHHKRNVQYSYARHSYTSRRNRFANV